MPKRLWRLLATLGFAFAAIAVYGTNTHQLAIPDLQTFVNDVFASASSTSTVQPSTPAVPPSASSTAATTSSTPVATNAQMVRVIDGDTIVVRYDGSDHDDKIRFLGINTPEVVDPRKPVECFGKEASAHMHELIDGQRIRLAEDPRADNVDIYGRLLRNVFLADGTDVNALMVRDGYAYAYLSFPLDPARKQELKKLENDARMAQRGLWSPTTCNGKK